ncbi:MAG: peptidylprolyl isomerase [Dehalococcoidales bacterium]
MTYSQDPKRKKPSRSERKKNRLSIPSAHPPKPVKKTLSKAEKRVVQAGPTPAPRKVHKARGLIIAVSSIVLVIALIAGAAYYLIVLAPMQRVILTVGKDNVETGYFLQRVVANPNGSDVTSTIQLLISELIIKQEAATEGVTPVTSQDIDSYLRTQAISELSSDTTTDNTTTTTTTATTDTTTTTTTPAGTTTTPTTISDAAFNKWFNEQLNDTGLSAKEYRQVAANNIQRQRLTAILSADIPSSMKQYHVWAMYFNSNAAAVTAQAKINSLSDFNTVANTNAGQTNGGDLGWMPLAVLPVSLESAAENLNIGVCSDPVTYQSGSSLNGTLTTTYWLLWLSDESDSMAVTPAQVTALQGNSLDNWLNATAQNFTITLYDRNGTAVNISTGATLDNDTLTWLNYEVQKLLKSRPSETTTTSLTSTTTTTTTTTTTPATTPVTTTTTGTSP